MKWKKEKSRKWEKLIDFLGCLNLLIIGFIAVAVVLIIASKANGTYGENDLSRLIINFLEWLK